MRALLVLALLVPLGACGDNTKPKAAHDAGLDAGPTAVGACLDRPDELPRAPSGALPCELLPPGFQP